MTAAAGGVGSLLVQLGKRAGAARVIGLASTTEKLEFSRSLGADAGFNYSSSGWITQLNASTNGRGAEIIYDTVGGGLTRTILDILAPNGELIFAALNRFRLEAADLEGMFQRNQSLTGFALLPLLDLVTLPQTLAALFHLVQSAQLRVHVSGRYPLEHVAEAHHALEDRLTTGKLVLIP